jgi:UDP-N-acetylmuramoyl-L-alanyl-D-glutamate--2,6-diaminopimelate ligase
MVLSRLLPDLALPYDALINGLAMDSRDVQWGNAFIAVGGFGTHGLAHVEQARARGASAILFEPPAPAEYPAPADAIAVPGLRQRLGEIARLFYAISRDEMYNKFKIVGVTGTNGKTSIVQMLTQAWHLKGLCCGSIGTLGAGLYGQMRPTGFTTPLVLRTHALLKELKDAGARGVAMEVSSHALDQGRVDGIEFDVGIFTNLTRDHLDYHGDMARYGAAKAKLFDRLTQYGMAVINLDDPFGVELFEATRKKKHTVGISSRGHPDATFRADNVRLDAAGISFDLVITRTPYGMIDSPVPKPVCSPLLGRFNVDNLLAVATVLYLDDSQYLGQDLSQLQPIAGRMNRLGGDGGRPLVVVDYAHTPDALEQALTSLHDHAAGKLICVFGCGGDRDRGKRPQMAALAERCADRVIVTDDNPRTENGDAIVADIMAGFADPQAVTVERDRARAIGDAIAQANAGDIVLIAGKGHEPYQEINGVRYPFDDTQVACRALEVCA